MLMKADPLKQRKITTMFQPHSIQGTSSEHQLLRDMEDFGRTEDNNVEITPRPIVTKKRKRDLSPIDARNWLEALGPPPPANNVKVKK